MLEGLVSGLLNRFLGMYVKNFDPTQLKVGIWSGDVKLRNLALRREALDQLKLPINVVEGHLGELTLNIPWSNLRGAPVKIFIEDVFLLASPKEEAQYNEEEEERRRQRLKMEKLDSAELLKERSQEGLSQEEQKKSQSFTQSLTTKIVDNIQITIKNIHIRYEDSISAPGHPFALGVTLEELSAISTDGEWQPTFIQDSTKNSHKLAKLGALSVYWNTDTKLYSSGREADDPDQPPLDHDDMVKTFKSMIGTTDESTDVSHQFILKPVSGQAKIEMDKSGDIRAPKLKASLLFDEIGLVLDDYQYRDALMMVDLFHYFIRHQEYKKHQPKGVTPKEDPRAWFRFAGNAVLEKIHDRNRRWSWEYFQERRDDRLRYIELFKKKKQDQQLSPDEEDDLNRLELKLGYEDLRFWRSLARNQLKKENAAALKAHPQKQQQQQGWVSWVWGSKPKQESTKEDENTEMTEEQRQELYEAIDWNEKAALSDDVETPRDAIKMQIEASLSTGSFTLRQDPHNNPRDLLSLHFDVFKAKAMTRPDSLLADVSLGALRVNDGTTPDSLYREIVRVKDAPKGMNSPLSIEELATVSDEAFFHVQYEQNPLDGEGDIAITAKLRPLEIVWNANVVVGVVDFFKPPERHMESISALMESASATVEELRQQTRAGLEFALEEHKAINAKLDLQAPLIIVPHNVKSRDSICLILDAGHIAVNSELVPKATLKEIQSKQRHQYTDEDYKRLESLMYDKFIVKLSSTQLLIGPSIEDTKKQLVDKSAGASLHVVEQINMDFVVQLSILPKAPNLSRLRVSGHLPLLHASVSDAKYKNLMRIIDVAVPKLGEDESQTPSPEEPKRPNRPRLLSSLSGRSNRSHRSDRSGTSNRRKSRRMSGSLLPFATTKEKPIVLDDIDEHDETKTSGPAPKIDQELKMAQKSFEFNFAVDELRGSLYRSDPDGKKPDTLLVELVAKKFDLQFYLRPFDMVAEVVLGSITVDDFVDNPPAEFKSIVSSGGSEDKQTEQELVRVKFIRVKKESPEFTTKYDSVETNLDAAITTINLIVTRKTLLTLLDFVLITFTNNDSAVEAKTKAITDDDSDVDVVVDPPAPTATADPAAIRIKVDLKSIELVLNNDGIRLATLAFKQAEVGIFLIGKTMRLTTKLGDLSLTDDINMGVSEESSFRKLVEIQGDELADFRYETFDADDAKNYPGYDSMVHLRAGSIKINFMEEPFRKIIDFLVKFGKMQALFNAARQAAANQAQQLQQSTNKFKFDVVVKTPIVVFPRLVTPDRPKRDLITAYLGEIYAENSFATVDDSKDAQTATKLSAGIRHIKLTSLFHYVEDKQEELGIIDNVDLGFDMTYAEHQTGDGRPETEITSSMTDFNLKLTQYQLKALLEVVRAVPNAFASDADAAAEEAEQDVGDDTLQRAKSIPQAGHEDSKAKDIDPGPELGSHDTTWTKLDVIFEIGTVGLELIDATEDKPVGDESESSLGKFSLDKSKLKAKMQEDGGLEAEFVISSFTIHDTRSRDANKFRRIMTSNNQKVQQFMASVTMSPGPERNIVAMVAIDSPKFIFALDYVFALQAFVSAGLQVDEPITIDDGDLTSPEESDAGSMQVAVSTQRSQQNLVQANTTNDKTEKDNDEDKQPQTSIAFRVNLVDAQVILIANPLSANSEAIVLGVKQVLLAQQHAMTLQVSKIGMFLCRMDKFDDSRLRIIDDFSMQLSMDTSRPNASSIHLEIEPLILRLSLRDILLALQIVSKASEMSDKDEPKKHEPSAADQKAADLRDSGIKQRTASGRGQSTIATRPGTRRASGTETQRNNIKSQPQQSPPGTAKPTRKHEELTATVDGIRVVLIGELHELPILDLSVKHFTATAEDWSSVMKAEVPIETFINVFNFSKSAWEPLLEPWQVGLGVAKDPKSGLLSVEMVSRKTFDITITPNAISLAAKSLAFLSQDDDVLTKPRGSEAPYRVRNYTGFDVTVRSKNPSIDEDITMHLEDGQEAPWSFEHWERMRETAVSTSTSGGSVAVQLDGSGFDVLKNIRISREGEFLFALKPKRDDVTHRLMVDVKLGNDNVKYVTLRSPLIVENDTQIPVELGLYDSGEGNLLKIEKIAPGESRPAPVGAVYQKSLLIRPDSGFGYAWSSEPLWWRDLLKKPTRTLLCKGEHGEPFYFQLQATFDKSIPLTKNYPYMKLKLSAPVTLENLLPYDFKYRIYDKNTKKDWSNFLRKGGVSPVHVVQLSHLLLLSVDMQDTAFNASDFAVINSGNSEDFRKEKRLVVKDNDGLQLSLNVYYHRIPDSGGAFKVSIYSPYVVLNKTGLELGIRSKGFMQPSRAAAGQLSIDIGEGERKVAPLMFSFVSDDHRNRAMLKLGDSEWSKGQSFDAIGSTSEVVLQSASRDAEMHVGITVEAAEGKYKMSKVVTLTPRFIVQNKTGEEINVREPSSSKPTLLESGKLQPLNFLQRSAQKQLCLCYPGVNNQWTSPFNISDLGTAHVKIAKAGERQRLVRVEILLEDATIFIKMSIETKNWPFSMRNESDTEFTFYQVNPNAIDEEGARDKSGWRPIRYRLPPRSIMPYAWDFPAAKVREIVIVANKRERHVKLAEIGNLMPMRLATPEGQQKIIDINVAADGPTQTLILSNYKQSKSLYRQKTMTGSGSNLSSQAGFEAKAVDTGTTFRAELKLAGIGISLINTQLKELAYITFRDLNLRYNESQLYQTVSLMIKWIQIDNQLYGGIFPMILYPSVVQKRAQETDAHPSLHAMITRVKDDSYGVQYIKYATVLLQQMTIDLDEDFIFAVLEYSKIPGATWTIPDSEGKLCDENLVIPEPSAQPAGQDFYFEMLNIQPMQLDLSFVRTERINAEDKTSSRNPLMFFFNVLTMAIGNVNDAPLRMNALMLENVRVSVPILVQNISNHYSQETLYQVHKILGSADFLGNPVGLFNNISSGIADVFYEPYQGLIMSDRPEDLGLGVARGAASLVKKSVFGFTDSFSKFTGAMSKGLAAATLDKQFQDRRRITRARNRPKHALYGVTAGANSLFTSVASGVGGVVRKPLEGAEQEGALGFFKGVGKGILGVATKPAIGVLDLASNVSEGIRNTTTVFDGSELDRVRLTRYINPSDGIVRPFSQREALGQSWLKQVDNGKYFDEQYIAHLELPREDMVVMITYGRILLIRNRKLSTEWDVPLKEVQTIAKERTGLSLTLRGGTNGPFIPIAEESGRAFVYKMVGVAVEEFNRRFRGME